MKQKKLNKSVLSLIIMTFAISWVGAQMVPAIVHGDTTTINGPILGDTTSWQIKNPAAHGEIQAYTGTDSVNQGQDMPLYVSTKVAGDGYTLDLYRLGYYNGTGGSLIREVQYPGAGLAQGYYDSTVNSGYPINCPTCITSMKDSNGQETYITDANWQLTNSIPTTSLKSGLYVVKLTETNGGLQWEVPFVVRNDAQKADLVYQVPFNTDEAYNTWGGTSFYANYRLYPSTGTGNAPFWAFYASFNRPYNQYYGTGYALEWTYSMVRFIEQMGYNVSYTTNNAIAQGYTNLQNYKGFVSAGHDEYWSNTERQKLETAIAKKVNVAFFGGNDIYWQIRNIPDTHGNQNGIMVEYKDVSNPYPYDPYDVSGSPNQYLTTTLWRKPPVNNPEDKILKTMYADYADYGAYQNYLTANTDNWVYKGLSVANGTSIQGILGYEVDTFYNDNSTTSDDHLTVIGSAPFTTHSGSVVTQYSVLDELTTGNIIFNAGSVKWPFGLVGAGASIPISVPLRTMTNNILSRMATGQPAGIIPQGEVQRVNLPLPMLLGDDGEEKLGAQSGAPKSATLRGSSSGHTSSTNGSSIQTYPLPAGTSWVKGIFLGYGLANFVTPVSTGIAALFVGLSTLLYIGVYRWVIYTGPSIVKAPGEGPHWGKVVVSDAFRRRRKGFADQSPKNKL